MRSSWVEVDLDVIKQNTEQVKSFLHPRTKLLATVKGNGYGHGAIPVSQLLSQMRIDAFGVAFAEEGVELREGGIKEPILLYGRTFSDSYHLLFEYDLMPNVFSLEQAKELNREAIRRYSKLKIHLSVDTGLHRIGFDLNEQLPSVIEQISNLPAIEINGIFSMFANSRIHADNVDRDRYVTELQFTRFQNLCNKLEVAGIQIPIKHICDSAGAFLFPHMQMDMVRIGSPLFGGEITGLNLKEIGLDFKAALSIHSRLASIRKIERGEFVGYDCAWAAMRPSVIGVVPFGTVDGVSGLSSGKGYVLIRGTKCPIVGEVCMDQMMVDMTNVLDPQIGDEVIICGSQGEETITPQMAASFAGVEDLEYLCRIGRRVPLFYKGGTI